MKLPTNFKPTLKTNEWAIKKHGYYDLPYMFISDFRQIHAAKGSKFENWQKALQLHINRNAPSGIYYSPKIWESAIGKCKEKLNRETPKVPLPTMKTTPKKVDRELARRHIREIFKGLNGNHVL